MKNIFCLLLLISTLSNAQNGAPASPYYNGFNWNLTLQPLKSALATKITTTHTNFLTYAQLESSLRTIDLDPNDVSNTNILLLYGYDDLNVCNYVSESDFGTSLNWNQHRRRNKNADVSGGSECAWNREHVYAQALGTPNLGTSGAGSDAHHLRTCDVDRNANRSSAKFGAGTGNSGYNGSFWYPGDEWKGDVARICMYLYLHYPTQCLPENVGTGPFTSDMLTLFLQWNADDPVSLYEDKRNTYLGNTANVYGQGNRNPFIDNPYLATKIWGGPIAQNRWPNIFMLETEQFDLNATVSVYPNPTNDNKITIETEVNLDEIQLITINGQLVQKIIKPACVNKIYTLENLSKGFYFMKLTSNNQSTTKKVIVN
jgi:endonuclease I